MAQGNMIVTLVAQTKRFQDGLRDAGTRAKTFGSIVGGAMNMALGALGLLAGAIIMFLPNFIKMGEEARKSELRLANVAKNMDLFGKNTGVVTKRISTYAEELSFLTGVDDELTRANQAVLLTFENLAVSADKVGGPFDRATLALLDLEAAGKNIKAVQLGKALQDPLRNMTALRKAGILLTEQQQKQIEAFMKANDVAAAQDVLLKAIEGQVGGTAAAMASSTDKMNARFEDILETLSGALLPAVDQLADKFSAWLESPAGKKALDDMVDKFKEFSDWIMSPEGKKAIDDLVESFLLVAGAIGATVDMLIKLKQWADEAAASMADLNEENNVFREGGGGAGGRRPFGAGGEPDGPSVFVPDAPADRGGSPRVTVNVSGITPTATIGRTVQTALREAQRLGMR
jgi:hypothetical protein